MKIEFAIGKQGEKVLLTSDENQYVIARQQRKKDGTPGRWYNIAYLSSPEAALSRIVEMNIRASEATSIRELHEDLMRAKAQVLEMWSTNPLQK